MFKKILAGIVVIGLIYGLNYAYRAIPIISGYGAKNLCSCVFVSGRDVDDVKANELKVNPLLSAGTFEINWADSSATGDVFGLVKKKAIYRKGLGCTLLSEIEEEAFRSQPADIIEIAKPVDSLYWPIGNQLKDTIFSNVNYEQLDKAIDAAFEENIPDTKVNTRGLVVVYKNHIIGEQYADNFNASTPQMGWSMTKSVTATLIGLLEKDRKIDIEINSANVKEWKTDDRSQITVDHLLRMSSGLDWEEVYSGPSTAVTMLYEKADMGSFAANQSLAHEPNEVWYYSSGTSNILAKLIRTTLGEEDYLNYVRNRLFGPLGMSSAVMETDASGTYVGSSYMYATPRDWAKFGLLYLNDGVWNGERLLPERWNDYVSTPTEKAPNGNYGAHFWLNAGEVGNPENRVYPDAPTDLYSANGFEGQRVFIIPSRDLVIVRMGQTKVRGSFDFNKFLKELLASVD